MLIPIGKYISSVRLPLQAVVNSSVTPPKHTALAFFGSWVLKKAV